MIEGGAPYFQRRPCQRECLLDPKNSRWAARRAPRASARGPIFSAGRRPTTAGHRGASATLNTCRGGVASVTRAPSSVKTWFRSTPPHPRRALSAARISRLSSLSGGRMMPTTQRVQTDGVTLTVLAGGGGACGPGGGSICSGSLMLRKWHAQCSIALYCPDRDFSHFCLACWDRALIP